MLLRAVILASALICGSALAVSLKGFKRTYTFEPKFCNFTGLQWAQLQWQASYRPLVRVVLGRCRQWMRAISRTQGLLWCPGKFRFTLKKWVFFQIFLLSIADLSTHGAYPGPCLVDALPACLLQASVEVRKPWPVRQHGQEVQRCRCQRHRRLSDQPHEVNSQIVT